MPKQKKKVHGNNGKEKNKNTLSRYERQKANGPLVTCPICQEKRRIAPWQKRTGNYAFCRHCYQRISGNPNFAAGHYIKMKKAPCGLYIAFAGRGMRGRNGACNTCAVHSPWDYWQCLDHAAAMDWDGWTTYTRPRQPKWYKGIIIEYQKTFEARRKRHKYQLKEG